MGNVLARKLSGFAELSAEDHARLDQLCARTFEVPAGDNLITEGDRPSNVFLLLEGWGYRYKLLEDGRRQIVAFLIPGDLCDIHIFILKRMDHSIGILCDAKVAALPKEAIIELMEQSPALNRALWWATLVDEAVLREWLVNAGQRDAYHRVAHLFCEMSVRMQRVGLAGGPSFHVPLTQEELGDTMGLTPVHVNRTLKRMRSEGLITLRGKQLEIHDVGRLMEIAGFNPNYLHLAGE
jgi:CRP-like cAMP-binding protein